MSEALSGSLITQNSERNNGKRLSVMYKSKALENTVRCCVLKIYDPKIHDPWIEGYIKRLTSLTHPEWYFENHNMVKQRVIVNLYTADGYFGCNKMMQKPEI